MKTNRGASILAGLASALLLVTAAYHLTGLGPISELAIETGGPLAALAPLLWIAFAVNLFVLSLAAALMARRPFPGHRWILVVMAIAPLGAALLQVRYLGFSLPTAILLLDAVVLITAGMAMSRVTSESAV